MPKLIYEDDSDAERLDRKRALDHFLAAANNLEKSGLSSDQRKDLAVLTECMLAVYSELSELDLEVRKTLIEINSRYNLAVK